MSAQFSGFLDSDGDLPGRELLRCQSGFAFSPFWERKPFLSGCLAPTGFLVLV